jgi:hypothetical protein
MALSISDVIAGEVIEAAHVTQFFNLLTGIMTDQPVTFRNTLSVGNNAAATGTAALFVYGTGTPTNLVAFFTTGAASQPVLAVAQSNGDLRFSSGSVAYDTTLGRQESGVLRIQGTAALDFQYRTTPNAPGAGYGRIYFKSDNLPYYRAGSAGAETALGGSAGGWDILNTQVFA